MCKAGTYEDEEGQAVCRHKCTRGRYGNEIGKTTLNAACTGWCNPGRYISDNDKPESVEGQTNEADACKHICEAGYFCEGKKVVNGKTFTRQACQKGRFGWQPNQKTMEEGCLVCNKGYFCEGGSHHAPCPPGRFGAIESRSELLVACAGLCPTGECLFLLVYIYSCFFSKSFHLSNF
jgi:hypothetical protein